MLKRISGIIGILVIWELAARFYGNPMFIPPSQVIPMWISMIVSGELSVHVQASLRIIFLGFLVAAVFGFSIAILMFQYPSVNAAVMPVLDAMRPVAALTLFPLIILLMGLGIWGKVFVIFWTAWPAIVLNSYQGLRTVDQNVVEAAHLDGAHKWTLLIYISIPLALPMIVTGLRIGLSGGWISLVAAEMLGSSAGLGYANLMYSQTFQFPQMYAVIITIAIMGLAMNLVLAMVQSRIENKETNYEGSKFIRYGDRASSFSLDSFRLRARNGRNRSTPPSGALR